MVKYVYDAWGNHKVLNPDGTENTAEDFIGNINPIRYRSYYYDTETRLYYLNARYYDPETCRFISPDSVDYLDPETIGGTNLYAYCNNNPVMYADPSGHFIITTLFVGAIVGALSYTTSEVISFALTGEWSWSWGEFFGSVIGGAIGAPFAVISPYLGAVVTSVVSTASGMLFQNLMGEENHSVYDIISRTSLSAVTAIGFSFATNKFVDKLFPVKPGYGNPLYMSEPMSMKLKLLYISITEKFSKRIANSFFDGLFETVYSGIYDAYNN